jgi:hypothetical protein
MDRFFGVNLGRATRIHIEATGGSQPARSFSGIPFVDAEILYAEFPDGSDHPTVLATMIVREADLPDIPADGENFKEMAFIDQVPRVVASVENVLRQSFRTDAVFDSERVDARLREFFLRDGDEAVHPFVDGEKFHEGQAFPASR